MTSLHAFTIAFGRPLYIQMAVALARSFLLSNSSPTVKFSIITDCPVSQRPSDLESIGWVEVNGTSYGRGFNSKLHLDRLAPGERSLFIDADCLIVRPLDAVFKAFAGRPVGVLGRSIRNGEWFGDVTAIIKQLGIAEMPRFNGGIYYLEPGPACTAIYDTARALLPRYDEIGFVRLRGSENDEVLMSAALALHGMSALIEDGSIMHTIMEAPGGVDIDVLSGRAVLHNPKSHPHYFDWMPLERMEPAIVHFLGADPYQHPYSTEILKLELVSRGWKPWAAALQAELISALPWLLKHAARGALRPFYHAVFGIRQVRPTIR